MNATEALARYLEIAISYDGCGAQHDATRFAGLVAPAGPPAAVDFFCHPNVGQNANSSCEVVAVGILSQLLRELGRPELQGALSGVQPAVKQWQDALSFARAHGALFSPERPGAGIRAGCIVHVEGTTGRHWYTVVRELGGGHFVSVDGGGQDAQGYQLIHTVTREVAGAYDKTSMKPVADWIGVQTLLESLLAGESDPADSCVDGDAAAFGSGEIA